MALGAKTFNFGEFLSFYSNNMEGNPNPADVAHDWWTSMDNDEKHWYFYDNEQKYIDFIDSVMSIKKFNLIIAPCDNYEDGIMLWWKYPSQKFHVPYPSEDFREKLLEWMRIN